MIDLQECRNEIDKIDSDIIRLFEQRMKVCEDVAEYKIRTGKKVLELLVNICRKENKTLIIVTHNTAIAQCADTVIHMKNSKIENIEKNTNVKSVGEVEL